MLLSLDGDKFVWNKFEQAPPGPKGESQGWLSYKEVGRQEGDYKNIRKQETKSLKE